MNELITTSIKKLLVKILIVINLWGQKIEAPIFYILPYTHMEELHMEEQ